MKNVKNMNDIAAIATAKVNKLIANGFVFNFGTMAGSQGDDFQADLTKDGITYRVRKNDKYTGKATYVVEFKNRVSKTADFKLKLN